MPAPENIFKKRLLAGETLIGAWLCMGEAISAEVMATAGYDWLLIDGEHSPNDIRSIRDQLVAIEGSASAPIVRVPIGLDWMMKQVLDLGAQTILVPMVDSAEQARALVRAVRYPPAGIRGVGAAAARATVFGAIDDYVQTADAQTCLLVQVESRAGLAALDEILAVEGVDGVFIGPADLSTDMGFQGNAAADEVQAAIADATARIAAAGKAPGILATTDAAIERYLDYGARFVAVGLELRILADAARAEAGRWKARVARSG